jgi:hypothetical protein
LGERRIAYARSPIKGPWMVGFDTAYSGSAAPVRSDSLFDWSRSWDSTIRYYSGTAIYTTSFTVGRKSERAYIDLGVVDNIATVFVNGVECGTVWTGNRVEITGALLRGENQLKILVTNTWANRLTGDQRLPEGQRRTWTTSPWKGDGSLLPAGLLGPVYLTY